MLLLQFQKTNTLIFINALIIVFKIYITIKLKATCFVRSSQFKASCGHYNVIQNLEHSTTEDKCISKRADCKNFVYVRRHTITDCGKGLEMFSKEHQLAQYAMAQAFSLEPKIWEIFSQNSKTIESLNCFKKKQCNLKAIKICALYHLLPVTLLSSAG